MTLYGQSIETSNYSTITVNGCPTREEAVYEVVKYARLSGDRPPKLWQIRLPAWPKHCIEEYWRQERESA